MTHGKQYEAMWKSGQVPDVFAYFARNAVLDADDLADVIQTDQFLRWKSGRGIPLRDYFERYPRLAEDSRIRRDLARHEAECRVDRGEAVSAEAIERQAVNGLLPANGNGCAARGSTPAQPPQEKRMAHDSPEATVIRDSIPEPEAAERSASASWINGTAPDRHSLNGRTTKIGRYEVVREIGTGAFGIVYLAHDPLLNRRVAVKVPRPDRFSSERDVRLFLSEAQAAASLRHPGIVAVHDSGRTEHGPFVVMDYIEGETLESLLKSGRPAADFVAELSSEIALALASIHEQGLVHRDLKPANVLIDGRGQPRISDFGMAVHESVKRLRRGEIAGTAYYMSPEQARGETHRLDGRTDVWALGVMMYEMLTGRRPFDAESPEQIFHEIEHADPIPPRQIDSRIPPELARITLKCLAKRMTDRYESATDLADELRSWGEPAQPLRVAVPISEWSSDSEDSDDATLPMTRWIRPPGLRAFEERDSIFFHDLLPGPRDRNGMPESIRFWKQRVEQTDCDETFAVGLIYGPSGCGKSSLVKAGLLPCLAPHVLTVRLDATPNDTEPRLLRALRKRCPFLSPGATLVEAFAELRDGGGLLPGQKVLVVIDQFEQWLHAHRVLEPSELVEAFRQCDGGRLQAVVMIRDDFWMAATRFMRALEVRVVEGENSTAVDLFDPLHAKKVLAAFARAFQKIPPDSDGGPIAEFLDRAVGSLTRDGKVVCVRLALFAEMVKGRPWTAATLNAVGGMDGVGVTFLEETFSAPTAPPVHKLHEHAARRVLRALLPEHGADIKGHLRTDGELRAASGYRHRSRDFEDLLPILDRELRLITPADPTGLEESTDGASGSASQEGESARFYQLTHDYLVPSLREWLTRKQGETRRGRAELKLAERAAVWNGSRERRHLPAWWEHLTFAALTRRSDWNDAQRRMMKASAAFHLIRGALALAVVSFAIWLGVRVNNNSQRDRFKTEAENFVAALPRAEFAALPGLMPEAAARRAFVEPRLRAAYSRAALGSDERLRYSVILSRWDNAPQHELFDALLTANPDDFAVLHNALLDYGDDHDHWAAELLKVAHDPSASAERRFRAAAALAPLDVAAPVSHGLRWKEVAGLVAERLVRSDASEMVRWRSLLWAARKPLCKELEQIVRIEYREPLEGDRYLKSRFSDLTQTEASLRWTDKDRDVAAEILASFAAPSDPTAGSEDEANEFSDWLCKLLLDCDEPRFLKLFPALQSREVRTKVSLRAALDSVPEDASTFARERAARRRANAAIGLAKLGDEGALWKALAKDYGESARSWAIDRISRLEVDPQILANRLAHRDDGPTTHRAILLSLGLYPQSGRAAIPEELRRSLIDALRLNELVRTAPDPGLRGAAVWLLRCWGRRDHEDFRGLPPAGPATPGGLQWMTNWQGMTYVVIPSEGRRVAFAAEEVVLDDFQTFFLTVVARERRQGMWSDLPRFYEPPKTELQYGWEQNDPAMYVSWHLAARYCNWLSERDGIPPRQWCYEFDGPNRMRHVADSLERTGYRLPTTEEWITACRGNSDPNLSRHYGDSDLLLGNYAWYSMNTGEDGVYPVGSRMPNDWGLFDMLGNVFEWIDDAAPRCDAAVAELPLEVELQLPDKRPMMGGAYCIPARVVVSTKVEHFSSRHADYRVGFRPVRTIRK